MNSAFLRTEALAALVLIGVSLLVQSTGMALLIVRERGRFEQTSRRGPVRNTLLMLRITLLIVLLHLLQVGVWSGFYRWHCFPSWESALYYSAASYSTVGASDLLLPTHWRLLGPAESVAGVLMCGLSASFLVSVIIFMIQQQERQVVQQSV
jgi:hypothetical protein